MMDSLWLFLACLPAIPISCKTLEPGRLRMPQSGSVAGTNTLDARIRSSAVAEALEFKRWETIPRKLQIACRRLTFPNGRMRWSCDRATWIGILLENEKVVAWAVIEAPLILRDRNYSGWSMLMVYVRKSARRRGLGSQLVKMAKKLRRKRMKCIPHDLPSSRLFAKHAITVIDEAIVF